MSLDYPCLRYLEALPYNEKGETLVILRDPTHLSSKLLVVSPEFAELLPLFNGSNSVRDIQVELSRRLGRIFFEEELRGIISQLEEAHFLDSETFRTYYARLLEDFRRETVRRPIHAGAAYPAEPVDLVETVSAFYAHPLGAGMPDGSHDRSIRALVAPHIDLRSGGPTYTHAYRALAESRPPDLFVIMGTGHMGLPQMFSICPKDFETPLGTSPVDGEFLRALRSHLPTGQFDEDISHRHEHTIEFQLVFLHHLFRSCAPRILPILCSFSYQDVAPGSTTPHRKWFELFVRAFRHAEQQTRRRICIIASVDFAHLGPRYGDNFRPDSRMIEEVSRKDRTMLEYVCSLDAEGFFDFVREESDRRRICGFPALYTMLHLMRGERGRLLCHNHTVMDDSQSFVTYASLVFESVETAKESVEEAR